MYCPECGHNLYDNCYHFCPECGAAIHDMQCENNRNIERISGIVFTNLKLLSESLGANTSDVESAIETFIEGKKNQGVDYRLLDAGNYRYSKSTLGIHRNVKLDRSSGISAYTDVLRDMYDAMTAAGNMPTHLFIIGGDDVIPMPQIRHYIEDNTSDSTIDTDIIYSYPYKGDMVSLLENQELFSYKQLLLAGRLPFGKDASLSDLVNYLDRVVGMQDGIERGFIYGQCDPNWKIVSSIITDSLRKSNLFPDLSGKVHERFYYRRLFLSPFVDCSNVEQVFNDRAAMYYFNLHGGEGEAQSGYYGALPPEYGERRIYTAIVPDIMTTAGSTNVVISEACYGAKFIGLHKKDSMMLSSLHSNTAVFVGSSRIAWGSCDDRGKPEEQHTISSADIIAKSFMESMVSGMNAGESFFSARKKLMETSSPGDMLAAVTVTEFNLFGDPTVRYRTEADGSGNEKCSPERPGLPASEMVLDKISREDCSVEQVESSMTEGGKQSLLEQVRNAVDANIAAINQTVSEYLYSNFGLEPRKPYNILKIKHKGKLESICFFYNTDDMKSMKYMVRTDPHGKISQVLSSK